MVTTAFFDALEVTDSDSFQNTALVYPKWGTKRFGKGPIPSIKRNFQRWSVLFCFEVWAKGRFGDCVTSWKQTMAL